MRRNGSPALAIDPDTGHPQVVVMMPAVFGGGSIRNGSPGLGIARNGSTCLLSAGTVWTAGTHLRWSVGTYAEDSSSGSWSLYASVGDDTPATVMASGGITRNGRAEGTAPLPGAGMRRIELGLWAAGNPSCVAAPAGTWQITTERTN